MTVPGPPLNDDQFLLDFIRDRDILCPCCQYDLRNLTVARCPECGNRLRLSVGYVEPSRTAWVVALIGLAAGAGLGLVIALAILTRGWQVLGALDPWHRFLVIYCMACSPLTLVLVVWRRRFLRLGTTVQWGIGIAACFGTTVVLVFSCP